MDKSNFYFFQVFFEFLETEGIHVSINNIKTLTRLLQLEGKWDRERLRCTLRCVICYNKSLSEKFDDLFNSFFSNQNHSITEEEKIKILDFFHSEISLNEEESIKTTPKEHVRSSILPPSESFKENIIKKKIEEPFLTENNPKKISLDKHLPNSTQNKSSTEGEAQNLFLPFFPDISFIPEKVGDEIIDSIGHYFEDYEVEKINIHETIFQTCRNLGFLQIINSTQKCLRRIVIATDYYVLHNHWHSMASQLIMCFVKHGISVECGHFFNDPATIHTDNETFRLDEIENRNNYILLLIGNSNHIDQKSTRFLFESLSKWEFCAWLEVKNEQLWDDSIAYIAQYVKIFPFSTRGLGNLVKMFCTEKHFALMTPPRNKISYWDVCIAKERYQDILTDEELHFAYLCTSCHPSMPINLALQIIQQFFPSLDVTVIDKILTLPGVSLINHSLLFKEKIRTVLAETNNNFLNPKNDTICQYILEQMAKQAPAVDTFAYKVYQYTQATIKLHSNNQNTLAIGKKEYHELRNTSSLFPFMKHQQRNIHPILQLEHSISPEKVKFAQQKLEEKIHQILERNIPVLKFQNQFLIHFNFDPMELKEVYEINLSNNQITEIPVKIGELKHLQKLNMSNNILKGIPKEIGQLSNLVELDLSYNQITEIPPEMGELNKLKKLILHHNQIDYLPETIKKLNLAEIHLQGNLFVEELLEGNPQEIINAILQSQKVNPVDQVKMIVLGPSEKEKNIFLGRLVNDTFATPISDRFFDSKLSRKHSQITFKIYNIESEKNYIQDSYKVFLTDQAIYLLIWDKYSEENVLDWLDMIYFYAPTSSIILVSDELNFINRHQQDVKSYPIACEMFYAVVESNEGIDYLRACIFEKANEVNMGFLWSSGWLKVKKNLEKDSREYIFWEEYKQICQKYHINPNDIPDLLTHLGYVGTMVESKNTSIIILSNTWILSIIKSIFSTMDSYLGLTFDSENIGRLLPKFSNEIHLCISKILIQYRIWFPLYANRK